MQTHIPEEVFSIGILDVEYHDRLLADLNRFSEKAGIPPQYVWSKLSSYCTDKDITWVRKMREGTDHGLVYVGNTGKVSVEDKMMAIAGACLRNYIDARVMTVQDVLSKLKNDSMPYPTLVLVPNFCMASTDASGVASWQAAALLGWLYSRLARNLRTVLYVGSLSALESLYGEAVVRHLKAHYTFIQ